MLPYRFDVNAPATIPLLVTGIAVLLLAIVGLFWRNQMITAGKETGAIAVARNPATFLIFSVIAALGAWDIALLPTVSTEDASNTLQGGGILVLIFGAFFTLYYLAQGLMVWVADSQGLTLHALFFRHVTIRWDEVDWVYAQRKVTQRRIYGIIPAGQFVQEDLVVEAGAKKKIVIPLNKKGNANRMRASDEIIPMVEQHATQALIGYDKEPFVLQKRQQFSTPVPR